ncbi:MAG: nitroreductase family protein [Candidatus Eisenbacteria bacterium]|nr:nitroreductase family protein [Candidatus Eisenbacteria bacterium]
MARNSVIETMLNRKSIRSYKDEAPSDEKIEAIVRAGQQAPFASQLYSVLLSRKKGIPLGAPLLFTICLDVHKLELIMARRNWRFVMNDADVLILGIQDAALMAENMVIAAESLGLGSCFLGAAPHMADRIARDYRLPKRVFPLVQLTMGYPAEDPTPRPRYPMDFVLFEDAYPELSDEVIGRAMKEMDEGYLAQDYYRGGKNMLPLEGNREETYTFDNYGWTEHVSRKWGQWHPSSKEVLEQLSKRGFNIPGRERTDEKP